MVVGGAAGVVVLALSGLALAALGLASSGAVTIAFAILMVLGGASSGTITTLGPAMASLAAGPEEQGDALALAGTFRAGALLAAPALVGGLLAVTGIPTALLIAAAGLGSPGLLVGRGVRRPRPDPPA